MRQPPVAQSIFCPRYKIEYLITKKSFEEGRTQKSIYTDLCTLLGGITLKHLWRIRRNQTTETGILSTDDLILLAKYFSCTIDDLVVASSPNPEPGSPDVSPEETGLISSTDPSSHS